MNREAIRYSYTRRYLKSLLQLFTRRSYIKVYHCGPGGRSLGGLGAEEGEGSRPHEKGSRLVLGGRRLGGTLGFEDFQFQGSALRWRFRV